MPGGPLSWQPLRCRYPRPAWPRCGPSLLPLHSPLSHSPHNRYPRITLNCFAFPHALPPPHPGLVVTPFLPGDSLLFATGALAALGKLNLGALMACYIVAATLGDAVNYASEWPGRCLGLGGQ
jgi:hypothetical protein